MLRFCALVECGTGVLIVAQADGYATAEHALAERVFASGARLIESRQIYCLA